MHKWKLKIAILQAIALFFIVLITAADSCNVTYYATGPLANQHSGTVKSFNFPEKYPAGVNCEYHFINGRETRLSLTFTEFDLREPLPDSDGQCAFDFVDLFLIEGDNTPMKMLGRKCGKAAPQPLSTNAQHVVIYFKSRSTTNDQFTGFRAEFSFLNDTSLLVAPQFDEGDEDSLCGVARLRGTGGTLTAPVLHSNRELQLKQRQMLLQAGMINCTWTIRITEGDQILINFMSLNLGPSEVICRDSYLLMYNSVSDFERTGSLEKICGRLSLYPGKTKEYVSTGPWLTIRYIYKLPKLVQQFWSTPEGGNLKAALAPTAAALADFESTLAPTVSSALSYEPNFRLVWTAIWNLKSGEECPGFECTGRQTCLDAGRVVCHKTPRYCIHPTLRCDGIPHCGPNDTSDEENCQLPLILSGVAAGIGILLTLIASISIIIWRIRMPSTRRTKAKPVHKPGVGKRSLKAGTPPHLGRMMEKFAERQKNSETTEYSAVITNQHLINTRSILATLTAQENAKTASLTTAVTAAESSSNHATLTTQISSRPIALRPSVVVNRHAQLVSVRFSAATPPQITPVEEQKKPLLPQPPVTQLPQVTQELLLNPRNTTDDIKEEDEEESITIEPSCLVSEPLNPPIVLNLVSNTNGKTISAANSPLKAPSEELSTTTTTAPPLKTPSTESGSISFPPPPTSEEIILCSTQPLTVITKQNSTTTDSSEDDRPHRKYSGRRSKMSVRPQQSVPLNRSTALDLTQSTAGSRKSSLDAKALAKVLRETAPSNEDGEKAPTKYHRLKSSLKESKSQHHYVHHMKYKERTIVAPISQQLQAPPPVPASNSGDFHWELRPGGVEQAGKLPNNNNYANVQPATAQSPSLISAQTPDSLAPAMEQASPKSPHRHHHHYHHREGESSKNNHKTHHRSTSRSPKRKESGAKSKEIATISSSDPSKTTQPNNNTNNPSLQTTV